MFFILVALIGAIVFLLILSAIVHSKQRRNLTKELNIDDSFRAKVQSSLGIDGGVISSITLFDVLYNTLKLDPHALTGIDHLHHAQSFDNLGDLIDFMKSEIMRSGVDSSAWRSMVHKYKGYTGEESVYDHMRDQGHEVEVPESGTAEGYDVKLDGSPYNVKVTDNPSYIRTHLNENPDIPVITNREMADAFSDNPSVHIDTQLSSQEAFHQTADTIEGIANIGDVIDAVPFVTLAVNCTKNGVRLYKKEIDIRTAVEHTAIDTTAVGIGGWSGAKIGLGLGLALAPATGGASAVVIPVATSVAGSLAGVFSGKGISGFIKSRHVRKAEKDLKQAATGYYYVFEDNYQNILNEADIQQNNLSSTFNHHKRKLSFLRRILFPSFTSKLYSMSARQAQIEKRNIHIFFKKLLNELDNHTDYGKGLVLYAQGKDIVYGIEPLPNLYDRIEVLIRKIREEKDKL